MRSFSQLGQALVNAAACRGLRAVEGVGQLGVGGVQQASKDDGRALLVGQQANLLEEGALAVGPNSLGATVGQIVGRQLAPRPAAMNVDRLALGDAKQPRPQVAGVAKAGIGAKRGKAGLLKAVVGIDWAHRSGQVAVDVDTMLVEHGLEGRQNGHASTTWQPLAL